MNVNDAIHQPETDTYRNPLTYADALRNTKPDPNCKTCKGTGSYPAGDVPGLAWSELCGCVTGQLGLDTGGE